MCIFVQNICQHEYGHDLSESQRDTLFQSHEAAEDPNANIWENWYMRCIATCIGKVGMAGLTSGLGVMMMRDFPAVGINFGSYAPCRHSFIFQNIWTFLWVL